MDKIYSENLFLDHDSSLFFAKQQLEKSFHTVFASYVSLRLDHHRGYWSSTNLLSCLWISVLILWSMLELTTYQRPQMSLFQFVPPLMFVKQLRVWLYPHSLFQNILHPHGIACQRAAASRCNMICIKWPEAQWDHQEGKQKSPNKFVISFKDCFPSQRFPWKYLQSQGGLWNVVINYPEWRGTM